MRFLTQKRFSCIEAMAGGITAIAFADGQPWVAIGAAFAGVVLSAAMEAATR